METNVGKQLKNKSKLIVKKCSVFTQDKIDELNNSEVQVKLDLLENAFTKHNEAFGVQSFSADETKVDQLIEDMERLCMSFIYDT